MKSRILLSAIALTLLLSGCHKAIKGTNREFQSLPPFKATVIKMEEIPRNQDSVSSAMALRDYRVTLKKNDGSLVVIERVSTIMGSNKNWPGMIPVLLSQPTLELGKTYDFPEDLYKIHPAGSK
jgi:hypothetical protein